MKPDHACAEDSPPREHISDGLDICALAITCAWLALALVVLTGCHSSAFTRLWGG